MASRPVILVLGLVYLQVATGSLKPKHESEGVNGLTRSFVASPKDFEHMIMRDGQYKKTDYQIPENTQLGGVPFDTPQVLQSPPFMGGFPGGLDIPHHQRDPKHKHHPGPKGPPPHLRHPAPFGVGYPVDHAPTPFTGFPGVQVSEPFRHGHKHAPNVGPVPPQPPHSPLFNDFPGDHRHQSTPFTGFPGVQVSEPFRHGHKHGPNVGPVPPQPPHSPLFNGFPGDHRHQSTPFTGFPGVQVSEPFRHGHKHGPNVGPVPPQPPHSPLFNNFPGDHRHQSTPYTGFPGVQVSEPFRPGHKHGPKVGPVPPHPPHSPLFNDFPGDHRHQSTPFTGYPGVQVSEPFRPGHNRGPKTGHVPHHAPPQRSGAGSSEKDVREFIEKATHDLDRIGSAVFRDNRNNHQTAVGERDMIQEEKKRTIEQLEKEISEEIKGKEKCVKNADKEIKDKIEATRSTFEKCISMAESNILNLDVALITLQMEREEIMRGFEATRRDLEQCAREGKDCTDQKIYLRESVTAADYISKIHDSKNREAAIAKRTEDIPFMCSFNVATSVREFHEDLQKRLKTCSDDK